MIKFMTPVNVIILLAQGAATAPVKIVMEVEIPVKY